MSAARRCSPRLAGGMLALGLGALAWPGCESSGLDDLRSYPESAPTQDVSEDDVGNDDAVEPSLPEEVEREGSFQAPVVTGRHVWTANPASGRVAVIDAASFEIISGQAGNGPTHALGLESPSGARSALVINAGAADASLLRLEGGALVTRRVPLHQGADSWSVSPDRRFAIAWSDLRKAQSVDPTDGFQDITVIDLADLDAPLATRLSVGYRPSAFHFDAQSRRAFGVTEDGISVVELTPGAVRSGPLVPLPSTSQPDVSITADGSRALARVGGSPILYDIDLASGQTRQIRLGGAITDLDVSADGSRAVAVVRERALDGAASGPDGDAGPTPDAGLGADAGDAGAPIVAPAPAAGSEAVFISLPAGLGDPAQRRTLSFQSERVGSVALSPDGSRAVLFSNGVSSGRVALVGPDLTVRSVDLIAPVRAVFVTADSSHAIALQDPPAGSVKLGAFSVVPLDAVRAPKLVAADAPAVFVALDAQSSSRAVVTVSDPRLSVFGTYFVRLPSLQVDFSPLSSEPLSTGMVPEVQKAFVAERHPEGRIAFIELGEGQSREITGFELSAEVVTQ